MPLAEEIAKAIDRYHAEHSDLTVWEILEAFDEIASRVCACLIINSQNKTRH